MSISHPRNHWPSTSLPYCLVLVRVTEEILYNILSTARRVKENARTTKTCKDVITNNELAANDRYILSDYRNSRAHK